MVGIVNRAVDQPYQKTPANSKSMPVIERVSNRIERQEVDSMKELFIVAHEELIERYLERHPNATEAQAYEATADHAYGRMVDNLADLADWLRKVARGE